jgi:hypothetical protein
MATYPSPYSYLKTIESGTSETPNSGDYVIGGYHKFDGVDEAISFGRISELEFQAADSFTISFWARRTGAYPFMIGGQTYGRAIDGDAKGWFINDGGGAMFFGTLDGANFAYRQIPTAPYNIWRHIAFIYNAGSFSAWINGTQVNLYGSSGTLFTGTDYSFAEMMIGAIQNKVAFGGGDIAEFAIWSSDQTQNIPYIYNNRKRHNLMNLISPPDLFYASLSAFGDNPDGTLNGVSEFVLGNNGAGENMEQTDATGATIATESFKYLTASTGPFFG